MIPTRGKKSTSGGIQLTSNMEKPGRGIMSPRSSATWQPMMETTTVLQVPMTSGGDEDNVLEDIMGGGDDEFGDIAHLKDLASEAPVIRLVNLLLTKALEQRAEKFFA